VNRTKLLAINERESSLIGPYVAAAAGSAACVVVWTALLSGVEAIARAEARQASPNLFDDGSADAPRGTPQLPLLLSHYAARPPWAVAGVNYHVGHPSDRVLKSPATISMAGVSVDVAKQLIRVTGDNVTLDGYDFGLGRGWGIYIPSGAMNTVVENSNFSLGSNNYVPLNAANAGNLTVRNCTFNGNSSKDGTAWAMLNYVGSGNVVVDHSIFENVPVDAIDFGRGNITAIIEYNVFENLGTAPGAHADTVQFDGTNSTDTVIAFNTVTSGEEGIQLDAQDGSTLLNSTIANNVVVATGPALTISYLIAAGQSPGNSADGIVVANNYLDYTGAYGPFYKPVGSNMTYVANVNMVTGRVIANPPGTSSGDVLGVTASPARGNKLLGSTITFSLRTAATLFVIGRPTLALNNGSTAVYVDGSGSSTLRFSYTVAAADKAVSTMAVMGVMLPAGASIRNANGSAAVLSGAVATFAELAVNVGLLGRIQR
jgi:hypothetical protein